MLVTLQGTSSECEASRHSRSTMQPLQIAHRDAQRYSKLSVRVQIASPHDVVQRANTEPVPQGLMACIIYPF